MSERKTAEIKFRCTPSFKAGLQAAAEAAGESMSEYIEGAVWAHQQKLEGTKLMGNDVIHVQEPTELDVDESQFSTILQYVAPTTPKPIETVPPSNGTGADCSGNCRPWEFCRCKASA